VDLDKENATRLANCMYEQYSTIFGGFVVRPKKLLQSLPVSNLHNLRIKIRDKMLSPRTILGSFYLANVDRKKQVLCRDFIVEAQGRDETQRQNVNNTADSYWLRTLNMSIENAENKIGTHYAVDIDASLFTPDSNNAW
jgi:hypothetical protein